MKKIACDLCGGTIGHVIGDSMIEIVRQGHKMTVVGKDYSIIASCPNTGKCSNKVAITAENGKILLENLTRKEEENANSATDSRSGDGNETKGDGGEEEGSGSKDSGGEETKEGGDIEEGKGGKDKEEPEQKGDDSRGDIGKERGSDTGEEETKDGIGDTGSTGSEEGEDGRAPQSRRFTRI